MGQVPRAVWPPSRLEAVHPADEVGWLVRQLPWAPQRRWHRRRVVAVGVLLGWAERWVRVRKGCPQEPGRVARRRARRAGAALDEVDRLVPDPRGGVQLDGERRLPGKRPHLFQRVL